MKAIFFLMIASSLAAPATHVVDWDAVLLKLGDVEEFVRFSYIQIRGYVQLDPAEPPCQDAILSLLLTEEQKIEVILGEMLSDILAQSFTPEALVDYFTRIAEVFLAAQTGVEQISGCLTEETREQVQGTFTVAYVDVEVKAKEMYALIREE